MTLAEFYDELMSHDWYYAMSDSHAVWQRGEANVERLRSITTERGPEYLRLFMAFRDHYYNGDAWGTRQPPLPERPPSMQC